jgi:hypothetical protein
MVFRPSKKEKLKITKDLQEKVQKRKERKSGLQTEDGPASSFD